MGTVKLTKARLEMLQQLQAQPGHYASYYPPLKWLLANGYATQERQYGLYTITDAGRALLPAPHKER